MATVSRIVTGCLLLSFAAAASVAAEEWIELFPEGGQGRDNKLAFDGEKLTPEEADNIFAVDGNEIRVLGAWQRPAAPFGTITTTEEYSSYDLQLEYRWGERKFAPRAQQKRDAGVLFHVSDCSRVWPPSLECQVQEGDVGDLWALMGADCRIARDGKPLTEPSGGNPDYRSSRRWELHEQPGWNTVLIKVRGSQAEFYVNGHLVNRIVQATLEDQPLRAGKISLQAEGAELTYRNVRLKEVGPLNPVRAK